MIVVSGLVIHKNFYGNNESNSPPPFYILSAPLEDQPELEKEGKQILIRGGEENEVRIYF